MEMKFASQVYYPLDWLTGRTIQEGTYKLEGELFWTHYSVRMFLAIIIL